VHFEFFAQDAERATRFYKDVFDWDIQKWEGPQPYWLVITGPDDQPGINGGVGTQGDIFQGTINTMDVPDLDEFVDKVSAAGGKVLLPKMAVPGVGWLAYCADSEGNTFGMMQSDEAAA
jgi:predicted enzyme related to lactoylglutathione lyase